MRVRRRATAAAVTMIGVGFLVAGSGPSAASPVSSDVAVTGYVAGGERTVESSHPVVFVFKETNLGPSVGNDSVDVFIKSLTGGTVTDQLCIFSTGSSFNPDSPYCEPGALNVHQSARMTVIVAPDPSSTVRIRACTTNEGGLPDPNSANDCKTLSVQSF